MISDLLKRPTFWAVVAPVVFACLSLHGDFWHLLVNMVVLFFFGPPLESRWGSREFVKYYFICGLGGVALSFLFASYWIVGASAAMYGLMLAFAMNWPYLFATASRSALRGKFDWIPFPAGDHQPVATFGGSMLAVTRTTRNPEVAWRLIDHLTSDSVEVERAIMTGDPPSLPSAYSDQLIAEAPQFGKQRAVFGHLTPRPGVSNYLDVSAVLQDMLSTALSGAQSPATALAHAASRIETLTPAS